MYRLLFRCFDFLSLNFFNGVEKKRKKTEEETLICFNGLWRGSAAHRLEQLRPVALPAAAGAGPPVRGLWGEPVVLRPRHDGGPRGGRSCWLLPLGTKE